MISFWQKIIRMIFKRNHNVLDYNCKCCSFDEKSIILAYIKDSDVLVENIIKIISLSNTVTDFIVDEKIGRLTIGTIAGRFSFAVKVDDNIRAAAALSTLGKPKVYITHTGSELTFQIILDRWEYWFTAIPSHNFAI